MTDLIDKIASLMSEHTGIQVKAQNLAANRALIAFLVVIGFLLVVAVQRVVGTNQALVESEGTLSHPGVETSPLAIVAVDHQEKITMCNARAAALHVIRMDPKAMVGKQLGNLFEGTGRPAPGVASVRLKRAGWIGPPW